MVMRAVTRRMGVVQNLGWLDRLVRFAVGFALVLGPSFYLFSEVATPVWTYYSLLVAIYPLMTGILGWDPFYAALSVKTCDTSESNQCGSFPYEVDAALGNHPEPEGEVFRELEQSHHHGQRKTVI